MAAGSPVGCHQTIQKQKYQSDNQKKNQKSLVLDKNLLLPKRFSHKKAKTCNYLLSRELLSVGEFRVEALGLRRRAAERKRQEDHKVESDISLTRVTFHFQPCKCLFAKNRPPSAGQHLACVYERSPSALWGRALPCFWAVLWILKSRFGFEKSGIEDLRESIGR